MFNLVFDWQISFHECYHVSRYQRCSSSSQQYRYNGFQDNRDEDTVQSTLGDAVDQVSMDLPTHEDIKLFLDKDIKQQHHSEKHHDQPLKASYRMQRTQQMQEEGCWQHRAATKLQDQANPLIMKENLETRAMRWQRDMTVTWRQRMEWRRSFMCWSSNSRKNMQLHR